MLKTRLFRNLRDQKLSFPPEGVAVIGGNAQGKSNLHEAIYYLETFRSFRGARMEHLIAFGEDVFRVAGQVVSANGVGGSQTEVAAAYEASSRRRKVTIDGAEALGLGDEVGQLSVGWRANMAVIAADFSTRQEVAAAICAPASRVVGVMVAGHWVGQLA